jgi:hypothetical protein
MSIFPYAFRKVFVGTGAVRTSGSTADLKAGELGLFDAKTYQALAQGATYSTNRTVLLAQGSFHTKEMLALGHGGLKDSIKSRDIEGHFISDFRVAKPSRPQNHIVTIGWDGVSATKTISAECDKDYYIRVDVDGEPVLKFLNHTLYHTFHVKTPCCEECANDCPPAAVDPQWVADEFVKQMNDHPYLNKFVKAEKIVKCTPAPGADPNDVAYESYVLRVADSGSQADLAAVQAAYPTKPVVRESREGIFSVYSFWQPASDGAPAAFNTGAFRVIPNCDTCPAGYTKVAKLYGVQVTRQDAGDGTALTTVIAAYSATSGVRLSYEVGQSVYELFFTTATTPAAVGTDKVAVTGHSIDSVCTLDSPVAVAWTAGPTGYKTTRLLEITINKDCDGDSREPQVEAFLAGSASVVSASVVQSASGTCAEAIRVRQISDNILEPECDAVNDAVFVTLPAFEGRTWEVVPSAVAEATCLVGIKLTGAYVETKFGDCSFELVDGYELDIPRIEVAQMTSFFDETADRCADGWPVTEIQGVKYASGVGETIRRQLIEFMGYRREDYFDSPRMRELQDIDPVTSAIDRNKYYKIYYLTYNVPYRNNKTNLYNDEQYELMVVFPEEANTVAFENLINGYITSLGVQLSVL